jgi:Zn-dependent protease with chaperone function
MSTWAGTWHDGAAAHPVAITVTPAGLWLTKTDGTHVFWPFSEIRQASAEPPLRLDRGAESLLVEDPAFLAAIAESGRPRPSSSGPWGWVFVGAALVLLLVIPLIYYWVLPALAAAAASYVPVSLEEQLGRAAAESLAAGRRPCSNPRLQRGLEELVARLAPESPYRFRITVVDDPLVNAFAAPGGYIVVFRGLLEKSGATEDLAGVLAHEMQHVLRRHTTRAIFRELALSALLAVVLGDASPLLTSVAGSLASLRLQRGDELEADREGLLLLQSARVDPRGLIRFLSSLESEAVPAYLSTHPATPERIRALERLAAQSRYAPVPLPALPKSCAGPEQL